MMPAMSKHCQEEEKGGFFSVNPLEHVDPNKTASAFAGSVFIMYLYIELCVCVCICVSQAPIFILLEEAAFKSFNSL